jgi:hypothetical protein
MQMKHLTIHIWTVDRCILVRYSGQRYIFCPVFDKQTQKLVETMPV